MGGIIMKKVISILAAVLILSLSIVPAFAESVNSPAPTKGNYNIKIDSTDGGSATFEYESEVDEDGNQKIKVHAIPDDGFEFDGWVVDGGNVTGDLSDPDAVLTVSSDARLKPTFKKKGVTPTEAPTEKKSSPSDKGSHVDNGSKSPQTGSNDVVTFAVLSVVALALASAVVVAKKTSKK